MVKTIIEETAAVSLLSTDLTLVWQPSQTPHTRQASMTQVLTSMAGLPANFTSVTTPSGALVVGPTTAQFNALSTVVSTTTTSMSTSQTQLTDLENRVAVLESGGTLTGITINGIADQNTGVTFVVSGSLIGYASAPTLQYRDNAGSFVSLPGGATVTASSYSFTHPSVGTATGGMTVTVRDSVATTVTATSNSFAIVSAAAGAPDPPTGLAFITNSGSSITVSFVPATTGTAIDAGGFQLQYKRTTATNWIDGPFIPYITPNVGRIVDPAGAVWQITSGLQITQTTVGGTVVDPITANLARMLLIRNIMWQQNTLSDWYWDPYTVFPANPWTGPITTSPLLSPGVRVPESGLGLAVNSSYNIRVAASNSNGLGLYSTPITASTATTDTFTTGSPIIKLPNGQLFRAVGVNVKWLAPDGITQQGSQWVTNMSTAEPLTSAFPGLNMVRIAAFSSIGDIGNASVADLKPFIDTIIALNIVVIVHCNISTGTLAGSDLTTVSNWYADLAVEYADSQMVWFEAQSNPTIGSANNDAMLSTIYGAVRGAGCESMFMVCSDIVTSADVSGYTQDTLNGMHNFSWDHHFYNAASNYSDDQDINNAALIDAMNALWRQADIPIIIGEFGDATDGQSVDVGWQQTLQTVYDSSGSGYLQAWWNTTDDSAAFAGNQLLVTPFNGAYLTQAGTMLRGSIISGARDSSVTDEASLPLRPVSPPS